MIDYESLFKISYGLYIVCSGDKNQGNGFISNTVFQVTSEPPRFAACCNKNNFTASFIEKHQAFSVSVLGIHASPELFGRFGYQSGRDLNKLAGMDIRYGSTGVPIVTDDSIAIMEFRVVQTVDVGSHLMFIGELVNAENVDGSGEPMTYLYYRNVRKGKSPKNAPTYIDEKKIEMDQKGLLFKRFTCAACGYIYDESAEELKFKNLPDNWICPACGSEKSDFIEIQL